MHLLFVWLHKWVCWLLARRLPCKPFVGIQHLVALLFRFLVLFMFYGRLDDISCNGGLRTCDSIDLLPMVLSVLPSNGCSSLYLAGTRMGRSALVLYTWLLVLPLHGGAWRYWRWHVMVVHGILSPLILLLEECRHLHPCLSGRRCRWAICRNYDR